MIASTSSGSSFSGLGAYLERGKAGEPSAEQPAGDRVAWTSSHNLMTDPSGTIDVTRAAKIMEATAELSPRCESPCYHVSLSFDPADIPGGVDAEGARERMLGVASQLVKDLKLDGHQVLAVAHRDREHPHVHLVVNRVHPETGRTWDRWQDRVRIEQSLREQERALGLREVPGQLARLDGQEVPARGVASGAYRSAERAAEAEGRRPLLDEARATVRFDVERAKTWDALEGGLAEHGLVLKAKGRGLVITDGSGREVKASSVSREGGRSQLETRLGETFNQHRARVAERTGGAVPAGLSPVAEAAVRTQRDAEAASALRATLTAAQERLAKAQGAASFFDVTRQHAGTVQAAFRRELVGVYTDPAAAERSFVARAREQGPEAAAGEMRRRPEQFGALREVETRKWGVLAQSSDAEARQAARGAADVGERYGRLRQTLSSTTVPTPEALATSRVALGRAQAAVEGRPSARALERRLAGLAKGLSGADRAVLGRVAPGALTAVGKAVAKVAENELGR